MSARTVPAPLVAALLGDREDLAAQIRPHGRRIGARTEVDVDAVRAVNPALADAIDRFDADTAALWDTATGAYVTTSRTIAEHRQVTGKTGRADLTEVFADLAQMSATSGVLEALTGPDPDPDELAAAAGAAGGWVRQDPNGAWCVQVSLTGAVCWPDTLGGPPLPTEVSRQVTLVARHAAWRDRRVRRLAQVTVTVEEMWADPTPARALLRPPDPRTPAP